eukprot:TRINITY_DN218_c0_g1_i23.p2 TRINITY_DN218_c0_g1~~TRINITY_DN218_c0_g1_i23.p2  ORF type:complete len:157 (+),score=100.62 TRINITY_DN218_c0_g1_i23:49-471(+)
MCIRDRYQRRVHGKQLQNQLQFPNFQFNQKQMSEKPEFDTKNVIIRARKFFTNKLLSRRQMVIDVVHPEKAGVPKEVIKALVAKKFKVDSRNVVIFGKKVAYGGGKTTCFCLMYDNHQYCLLYTSPSPRDKRQSRMPSSA